MLRSILSRLSQPGASPDGLPRPDAPVCIIGDIHGRADLLDAMFARIAAEPEAARARIVTLGDMIDRGPDSAQVLSLLHAAQRENPARMVCLMGNHERMMLDFLISPDVHTVRWLNAGGAETLLSFGITPPDPGHPDPGVLDELRMELARAIGPDLLAWVDARPLVWRDGRIAATHAGADPYHPLERQSPDALLWGHPRFATAPRRDGVWIAYGHWIVEQPFAGEGRIALDTGAFNTGVLSAAWIDRKGLKFLQVQR
ncbi:metallophosphoesterase [Thioclava atlantica]|nr:metallophosphoesterase [Thioclava atlantica]